MTRWFPSRRCLVALLALLPLACGRAQGEPRPQEAQVLPRFQLSAEEIRVARELAEHDLVRPENRLSLADKIVFTKIELLPDSQAETTQRLVLVTHYCYRGDEAVLTTVDLNTRQVMGVERAGAHSDATGAGGIRPRQGTGPRRRPVGGFVGRAGRRTIR